jgi:glucose/arabinose dehydrogenase
LAVGDFQRADLVLLDQYQNGKIIKINKNNGSASVFARGVRNPQGLFFSSLLKNIVETEHGPEGGDEINLIKSKIDYGWPHETLGIPYNADPEGELFSNFGGATYGSHDNYEPPIFSFIPSIGIKAIEEMPKDQFEFPRWKNDFIICSLKNIYRIRFSYNPKNKPEIRVLFVEPIEKGGCRDLAITRKGVIFTNEFKIITRAKGMRG